MACSTSRAWRWNGGADTLRSVAAKKLGPADLAKLRGNVVGIHYNLNQCRRDTPPSPGEACWAVKAGGKVVGYAPEVTINDVSLLAQPKGVLRIRARGQRQVVAWAKGTLQGASRSGDCLPLTINPFKDRGFVVLDGKRRRQVDHAAKVIFKGRRALACGIKLKRA